jgi:hypothetical protein
VAVELIVTRTAGPVRGTADAAIAISQWKQLVAEDDDLRWRVEPYVAVNPRTDDKITIKVGEADTEIRVDGQWLPFLRFRNGRLTTRYAQEFDDPRNAIRVKIAAVAKRLEAMITTDAGDDLLAW